MVVIVVVSSSSRRRRSNTGIPHSVMLAGSATSTVEHVQLVVNFLKCLLIVLRCTMTG